MKNIGLLGSIFFFFLLAGCLDDEGNYKYADIQEPQWRGSEVIPIYCKEGETAQFRGRQYYTWPADSVRREQEVNFEWKVNGVVLGDQADFDLPVSELIQKLHLAKLHTDAEYEVGTFSITDKQTKVSYLRKFTLHVTSARSNGDWLILSENGEKSKLSYISRSQDQTTRKYVYTFEEDAYEQINGTSLEGKPIGMRYSYECQNVSPIGSTTVMTESGTYEINNENLMKVGEIKDQFTEGAPSGLKVVARTDAWESGKNAYSFIVSEEGKIYQRKMSRNNLGGSFLSQPMVIDNKGYEIHGFGVRWFGYGHIPCYDEKNRRVIISQFADQYMDNGTPDNYQDDYYIANCKFSPVKEPGLGGGGGFPFPPFGPMEATPKDFPGFPGGDSGASDYKGPAAWGMPEGTEMLHLGYIGSGGFFAVVYYYALIYNDASGNTTLGIFGVDGSTLECQQAHQAFGPFPSIGFSSRIVDFPTDLESGACILTNSIYSGRGEEDVCYYLLYAKGREVHSIYIPENYKDIVILPDFGEKITTMAYTHASDKRTKLLVGGENGKLALYDISNRTEAKLIQEFGSVGGKVVALKEVCGDINTDNY